ncbi:uncharacterized protein LOC129322883 [Prosopis cineraria]|uniref:uncharacterized protein LOC129322883 n=1 Tax=Prosopis cineraria TaxID=364024 RepID=UPI00240FF82E|nr:uncharacterized protein LOC129322883 [Prosopis cineraria]
MQAQLASNITFQQARGKELIRRAASRERAPCSLSHRHNSLYHRIGNAKGTHPAESSLTEYSTEHEECAKGSIKAPKTHQLGFSYLALSFHYIVRKVKAFYNGFLGGVASESMMGSEASTLEPYFSIPVLPHP